MKSFDNDAVNFFALAGFSFLSASKRRVTSDVSLQVETASSWHQVPLCCVLSLGFVSADSRSCLRLSLAFLKAPWHSHPPVLSLSPLREGSACFHCLKGEIDGDDYICIHISILLLFET